MFGRGGGGGDLWAVVPMDHAVPGCLTPSVPTSGPFPHYQQGFAPLPSPEAAEAEARTAVWTEEENRAFEAALVEFDGATEDGLASGIAARIPGKTADDVREHYRRLVRDLMDIEAGVVELPEYSEDRHAAPESSDGGAHLGQRQASTRAKPEERKKGIPWTEEEHKRFLEGLEKYGKGDWRSISRNSVVTRTPTQVASHAQKYFLRQNIGGKKERRRSSIHDVTRP